MKEFATLCDLKSLSSTFKLKWPKLKELTDYFAIINQIISFFTGNIYNITKINAHDSRYDSAATYLCFQKAIEFDLI
jgi:hypothetical protein